MNSVHEALMHGVPMLTLPQSGDQFLVAARLAQLGAGLPGRATQPRLTADLLALLGDTTHQASAAVLGEGLRDAGGLPAAVAAVLAAR